MKGAIEQAIRYAAQAGKLRAYVRNGTDGLGGLERLADHMSALASAHLGELVGETPRDTNASPARHAGG